MTLETMNREPSSRAVAAAQLRMIALLQRRDFMILGGITAVLVGLMLWAQIRMAPDYDGSDTVTVFLGLAMPLAFVGWLWPLGVWRADTPEQRGYFWSLPVDRRRHTIMRVGMGWIVLMGVCLLAMAIAVVTLAPSALRFEGVQLDLTGAWAPLATATLAYVTMSAMSIFFDSPLRAVALAWLAVLGLFVVGGEGDLDWLEDGVEGAVESLFVAMGGPLMADDESVAEWAGHYLAWLGVGAAALVGAVLWRHQDQ